MLKRRQMCTAECAKILRRYNEIRLTSNDQRRRPSPTPKYRGSGLKRLTQSSHNSTTFFGSLSSAILSTCPAHCSLLLTRLSVKLLCSPVYSLNSTFLLLSALFTLAIFRIQLFSHTCRLSPLLLYFGQCQSFRSVQACRCHKSAHDLAL